MRCIDAFLPTQQLSIVAPTGATGSGIGGFSVGQVVAGSISNATGEVVGVNLGAGTIAVQLTNYASGFLASGGGITELVIGPSGRAQVNAVANIAPLPAVSWDEQTVLRCARLAAELRDRRWAPDPVRPAGHALGNRVVVHRVALQFHGGGECDRCNRRADRRQAARLSRRAVAR
jgi:hypothetical protein